MEAMAASSRKFNGVIYNFSAMHFNKKIANKEVKSLRETGYNVRTIIGKSNGKYYYVIYCRRKRSWK